MRDSVEDRRVEIVIPLDWHQRSWKRTLRARESS